MAAQAWMQDVEDGQGALDLKTMQLIGLAEAAAMAGYVRNWCTVLYGTEADVDAYHAMVDGLFAAQ